MHLDAETLFRSHAAFVAGFLTRLGLSAHEVDDAVQEVFLVVHRRGGFVDGPARPTTWLAEIALRIAAQHRRRGRIRQRETTGEVAEEPCDNATPFDAISASESLEFVQRALDALTLEHRAVFVLYEVEEESCESIAAGLQIPVGTVHSRLHAARKNFQKAFDRVEVASRAARPLPGKVA